MLTRKRLKVPKNVDKFRFFSPVVLTLQFLSITKVLQGQQFETLDDKGVPGGIVHPVLSWIHSVRFDRGNLSCQRPSLPIDKVLLC